MPRADNTCAPQREGKVTVTFAGQIQRLSPFVFAVAAVANMWCHAAEMELKWAPGSTFRDTLRSGGESPEMVVIPAGSFRMGCLSNDDDCTDTLQPVHRVTIPRHSRSRNTR